MMSPRSVPGAPVRLRGLGTFRFVLLDADDAGHTVEVGIAGQQRGLVAEVIQVEAPDRGPARSGSGIPERVDRDGMQAVPEGECLRGHLAVCSVDIWPHGGMVAWPAPGSLQQPVGFVR
jgi:hypothetical protein